MTWSLIRGPGWKAVSDQGARCRRPRQEAKGARMTCTTGQPSPSEHCVCDELIGLCLASSFSLDWWHLMPCSMVVI